MTDSGFTFTIDSIPFDADYHPADNTRITTNFANLARGESRRANLSNTLVMIDRRFNALMHWDNPRGDRYSLALSIVSAALTLGDGAADEPFPLIEILHSEVTDRISGERHDGMTGNNFSSYVRDYDFSIVLPDHLKAGGSNAPDGFGDLHGQLFRQFVGSAAYRDRFRKPPVICLSVSSKAVYHRTANVHPILGVEYRTDALSPTDRYFEKMGMKARYFMPPHSVAPFAFYHIDDLVGGYSNLELASAIAVMETFQKIYRPEIYNANSAAAEHYQPSLTAQDYSLTRIVYDREERRRLAVEQGRFAEAHFIKPHADALRRWSATAGR